MEGLDRAAAAAQSVASQAADAWAGTRTALARASLLGLTPWLAAEMASGEVLLRDADELLERARVAIAAAGK